MCVKCEVWEGYAGCGKSVVSAVCVGCTACELASGVDMRAVCVAERMCGI